MSPDAWHQQVREMIEQIDLILGWVDGAEPETFAADTKTNMAVRMAFVVLGEASTRLPVNVRDAHADVPWREVRAYRNFVIHVYDRVDPAKMLVVARASLPALRRQLLSMLPDVGP